jgi:hypothetical protein
MDANRALNAAVPILPRSKNIAGIFLREAFFVSNGFDFLKGAIGPIPSFDLSGS